MASPNAIAAEENTPIIVSFDASLDSFILFNKIANTIAKRIIEIILFEIPKSIPIAIPV